MDSIEGSFTIPENKVYEEPPKKLNKTEQVEDFITKLPRKKKVTYKDIGDRFCLKQSTVYVLMRYLTIKFNLSTNLELQKRDNGSNYLIRVYFKP